MKRTLAVAGKELSHILRDPTSLTIVFLLPLVMIFLYSYALNFDLVNVQTRIIDGAQNEASRDLIRHWLAGDVYRCSVAPERGDAALQKAERDLQDGRIHQILVIPENWNPQAPRRNESHLRFIIDGSDTNTANRIHQSNQRLLQGLGQNRPQAAEQIHTTILHNPALRSADFFVPGLVAILLIMISALLTSLSVSREKENGSIDLLFISPLKSGEIILGKTLPYVGVSLLIEALILATAVFIFQIPFRGSLLVLMPFSLLYILTGLSLGILISTAASNQKAAMFIALLATMLPSIMLSGFIFPLVTLPLVLQVIARLVPATYFLAIIRGVGLKGSSVHHFWQEGLAMLVFTVVLVFLSTRIFSRKREKNL